MALRVLDTNYDLLEDQLESVRYLLQWLGWNAVMSTSSIGRSSIDFKVAHFNLIKPTGQVSMSGTDQTLAL